jgi:two-component system nitrogen regulation response regulator GlnG
VSGSSQIWVVDNDASIRWVLERAFIDIGLSVRQFGSADEALEALEALDYELPNVVITDIRMPGKSGLEFLETLGDRFPEIPVVVMTAYTNLDDAMSAYRSSAFEYLSKPFDLDKATALVKRALAGRTDWQTALRQSVEERLSIGQMNLLDDLQSEFEQILLQTVLAFTGGRKQEAARWIGWSRNTLTRKLKELEID